MPADHEARELPSHGLAPAAPSFGGAPEAGVSDADPDETLAGAATGVDDDDGIADPDSGSDDPDAESASDAASDATEEGRTGYVALPSSFSDDEEDGADEDDQGQDLANIALRTLDAEYAYTINARPMAELEAELKLDLQPDDGASGAETAEAEVAPSGSGEDPEESENFVTNIPPVPPSPFAVEPLDPEVASKIKALTLGFNLKLNKPREPRTAYSNFGLPS